MDNEGHFCATGGVPSAAPPSQYLRCTRPALVQPRGSTAALAPCLRSSPPPGRKKDGRPTSCPSCRKRRVREGTWRNSCSAHETLTAASGTLDVLPVRRPPPPVHRLRPSQPRTAQATAGLPATVTRRPAQAAAAPAHSCTSAPALQQKEDDPGPPRGDRPTRTSRRSYDALRGLPAVQ